MAGRLTRSRWAAIGAAVAVTLGGGGVFAASATESRSACRSRKMRRCSLSSVLLWRRWPDHVRAPRFARSIRGGGRQRTGADPGGALRNRWAEFSYVDCCATPGAHPPDRRINGPANIEPANRRVPGHRQQFRHHATAVGTDPAGGGQPHENRPPFLAVNYIISLFGIYPSQ